MVACCVAWLVPPVVAAVRALRTGWYPLGDQALIAIRARDVLTDHHPLLGTAASAALGQGYLTNHLGPLIFDLAAAPVRLFGSGSGLAIAIAAMNFGAGLIAILAAAREGGRAAAVATTIGLGALVWSAGNQVLIDPYNPTASMVPFFAVLVLAWSAANGDRWALPWLVLLSSFCVQTNLAYLITTVPIVFGALAAFVWSARGQHPWLTIARRCLPIAVVVWFQPVLEQVLHGRDGNLARLVHGANHLQPPLGLVDGTKRASSVVSLPSTWGRGRFDSYGFFDPAPSALAAFGSLLILLAMLVTLTVVFRRRFRDNATATLLACAAAFVVVGWVGAVRVPLSPFYGFNADYVRWLWPIGIMCPVALGVALCRLLLRYGVLDRRARTVTLVTALVLGIATLAAAPAGPGTAGNRELDRARKAAVELNRLGVARLPSTGAEFDPRPPDYPVFGYSLLASLQEHGIPFFTSDPISIRQFGVGRRPPDEPPPSVYVVAIGLEAVASWDRALGCVSDLGNEGRDHLLATRDALAQALAGPGFALSYVGQRFAGSPFAPTWMPAVPAGRPDDALAIVNSSEFATLLGDDLLVPPAGLEAIAREFLELRRGVEDTTACIVGRDHVAARHTPASGEGVRTRPGTATTTMAPLLSLRAPFCPMDWGPRRSLGSVCGSLLAVTCAAC